MEFDSESTYGTYAPKGAKAAAISVARAMPQNWLGRKVVSLFRSVCDLRDFGPYDVQVFGQGFRVYPSTNRGDKNVLTAPQFFDPIEREAIAKFFRANQDAAFVDLGANIGVYSAFAKKLGFGEIISIEAGPEVFARLNFNLPDDITKLNIAIAEEEGELPFYINEKNRGENSLVKKTGKEVRVPAKPLLSVVRDRLPQKKYALKIDVEGMEEKIFKQLFKDAQKSEWPSLIVIEHFHAPQVAELIESYGYERDLKTKLNSVYSLPA